MASNGVERPGSATFDDGDEWKGMVAGQFLLATRQAVRGLAGKHRAVMFCPKLG